jgi:DNA-binding transcriptional LysR family regulator
MPLGNRVPELSALDVLLAVARAGSLNGAAPELGVSQQAVSARMTAIEAQTGIRLLDRSRSGSTLTGEGVVVAEWASRVLDAAHELDVGLAAMRADHRGRLRVSASLTIAEHLLPGWLVSFQAAAHARSSDVAEVTLTATNSGSVVQHVRKGSVDLGFIESPTVPAGLRSRIVARDELVLVARPDHPFAKRRTPIDAHLLATTPLVSRETGSGTRDVLEAALRTALGSDYTHVDPVLDLSTTSAIRSAVQAGAGPAVLSELAVSDDIASRRLVRIAVLDLDLRRALRAVWIGPRTPPAGAARDLVAHISAPR